MVVLCCCLNVHQNKTLVDNYRGIFYNRLFLFMLNTVGTPLMNTSKWPHVDTFLSHTTFLTSCGQTPPLNRHLSGFSGVPLRKVHA